MKKITLSLLGASLLSASSLFAATISLSNTNVGAFDVYNPIINNDGVIIPFGTSPASGTVQVGYFTDSDTIVGDGDFDSFQSFGTAGTIDGGGFDYDGLYTFNTSELIASGSPFIGESIYTFITVGDEYLVVKSGISFAEDAPSFAADVDIAAEGTLIWGNFVTGGADIGAGAVDAYQLVPVPEPSTFALLGGLLALTCVMLRRRA
ncbi:MAG: PEP-CTERM sorting domain-containing protein [Verrucomicrobiota bacterium]|nr:PEP-CTERM sorting domain-containing protein [Verrucomicrobiota bacterium]